MYVYIHVYILIYLVCAGWSAFVEYSLLFLILTEGPMVKDTMRRYPSWVPTACECLLCGLVPLGPPQPAISAVGPIYNLNVSDY